MTHPDALIGKDDTESKTVREWGEKRAFSFAPKDHVDLMQGLDLVDLEAGAKVAGHRVLLPQERGGPAGAARSSTTRCRPFGKKGLRSSAPPTSPATRC